MRRMASATLVLLAVLGLATFAAVRLIDVDVWRDDLASTLSARLGLDVRIGGKLRLELGQRPEIVVSNVSIHEPDAGRAAPLARLDAAAFEADLLRSWRERRIVISQVRASGIAVALRRDEHGVGNWQLRRAAPPPEGAGLALLSLDGFALEDARLTYATAMSDWAFELDIERLDIEAPAGSNELSVEAAGSVQGNAFALQGTSTSDAHEPGGILGDRSHLELDVSARIGPLRIGAVGSLDEPRRQARADLSITLHADDLGSLRQLVRIDPKLDLDGIGALDVAGRLVGGGGSVRLDDVVASIAGEATGRLAGRGRIGDLVRVRDIDLALTVDTPNLADVAGRLRIPHPEARRATGTGALRGDWPAVAFEEIDVDTTHRDGHSMRVQGRAARVEKKWAADLGFAIEADLAGDVATITEEVVASIRRGKPRIRLGRPDMRLQQIVMAIGPAHVTGRVAGRDKDWTIRSVRARAGRAEVDWLRASGRIASLVPAPSGIAFDIEAGSDAMGALIERAEVPLAGLERLRLSGRMVGEADRIVLEGMQAIASTDDRITIGLSGDLPMRETFVDTQLLVAVSASDLAVVGETVDRPLPAVGPVELSTEVKADGEALVGRNLMLGIGESRVDGSFRVEPGEVRPHVTAQLESERFRLRDLGLEPGGSEPAEADEPHDLPWVDRPLPFDDLFELDGELALRVDRLVGREGLEASDVELRARLDDGVLDVEDLRLVYEGGLLRASLHVAAGAMPAEVELWLGGDGFRIERVLAQFREERVADGTGQLIADLRSRGVTPRELGANLDGDLLFYGREGGLAMRYSRALQLDFGNRAPADELEPVECLIVDASARNGRLTLETVLFDTANKQVLGAGDIDLAREQVELMLTPVFKRTIPGSVATAVRVHGAMTEPTITPAPLVTAAGTAQGLVDRALLPLNRILPGVGSALAEARRAADRALENTGVDLPVSGLWRPGIDVSCDKVLHTERIEALRAVDTVQPG